MKELRKKEKRISILKQSLARFKSIDTVLIAFYDALFYILMFGGAYFYLTLLEKITKSLEYISLDSLFGPIQPTTADIALIQAYTGSIKAFLWKFALITAVLYIFLLLAWSLSRSLIWKKISGKKMDGRAYLKFTGLTFLWDISIGLLFAILYYGLKTISPSLYAYWSAFPLMPAIIIVLLLLVIFHFLCINYLILAKTGNVFSSIKQAFSVGTLKIRNFLLPYAFAIMIFAAINLAARLLEYLHASLARVFYYALLLLFFVWLRQSIASAVEESI